MDSVSLMLLMERPTGAPADWHRARRPASGRAAGRPGWLLCETEGRGGGQTDGLLLGVAQTPAT